MLLVVLELAALVLFMVLGMALGMTLGKGGTTCRSFMVMVRLICREMECNHNSTVSYIFLGSPT